MMLIVHPLPNIRPLTVFKLDGAAYPLMEDLPLGSLGHLFSICGGVPGETRHRACSEFFSWEPKAAVLLSNQRLPGKRSRRLRARAPRVDEHAQWQQSPDIITYV